MVKFHSFSALITVESIFFLLLSIRAESIWKRIEVVITALTRNQVYGNVSWVRIPPLPPQEGDFHSGVPFFYASLCHTVHIPKCPKPLINCATLFQSVQLIAHWGRRVGHFRGHFRSHRQCHFLGAFRGANDISTAAS